MFGFYGRIMLGSFVRFLPQRDVTMLIEKKSGTELGVKVFRGNDGNDYLVFRTLDGSFHAFVEVAAKQAARECGATEAGDPNTRTMWQSLWDR